MFNAYSWKEEKKKGMKEEKKGVNAYISSHSKHSGDEIVELSDADKRILKYVFAQIKEKYKFK